MQDDDAVDALFDAARSDAAAHPPAGVWESALEAAFSAPPVSADEAGVPEMGDEPVHPDDEIALDDGADEILLDDSADEIAVDDGPDELVFDDDAADLDFGTEDTGDGRDGSEYIDLQSDDPGDGDW